MLPIRMILHPTDFSEPSDAAFRLACVVARDYGSWEGASGDGRGYLCGALARGFHNQKAKGTFR